jgi:hypothetical protein
MFKQILVGKSEVMDLLVQGGGGVESGTGYLIPAGLLASRDGLCCIVVNWLVGSLSPVDCDYIGSSEAPISALFVHRKAYLPVYIAGYVLIYSSVV